MLKKNVIATAFLFLFAVTGFGADEIRVSHVTPGPSLDRYVPGEIIVKFKDYVSDRQALSASTQLGATVKSTIYGSGSKVMQIPAKKSVEEMVVAFKILPEVEYAHLNYIGSGCMTPNDPQYYLQWHMPKVKTEGGWDQSTGSGVVVAVIDGGVAFEDFGPYKQAPDLAGTSFVPGWDFVNNDSHPNDDRGHGTHVTGTIAQTTNNWTGVTGVAFGCSIMPVKVIDANNNATTANVASGIYWAADNGAKVINMSLRVAHTTELQNAVIYADGLGVTIVCAAGNENSSTPNYPAAYQQSISVSAIRYDETRAPYSSYGSTIDVCAPGGDNTEDENNDGFGDGVVQSTHDGINYSFFFLEFMDGTSMASPHVAGLAALLISKAGTLTPAQVRAAIQNTAKDLGTAGWDQFYGHGLIDCNAALLSVSPSNPPVADFSASPTSQVSFFPIQFSDLSTGGITSWYWEFEFGPGGDDFSIEKNPSYDYSQAGTYTVKLTVTGPSGSDNITKTDYITISPCVPPVADFVGVPTTGNFPLVVNFTDLTTGGATSWRWIFGDGTDSDVQNPQHTYTSPGSYNVALIASNPCPDVESKSGYIYIPPCDDFHDDNIDGWSWESFNGYWQAWDGVLHGNNSNFFFEPDIKSPFGSFTTATIDVDLVMYAPSDLIARVNWGYVDDQHYRFVEANGEVGEWRIYEHINTQDILKLSIPAEIDNNVIYNVVVVVKPGGAVAFSVDGQLTGFYNFGSEVEGSVGVGFDQGHVHFDNFCADSTSDGPCCIGIRGDVNGDGTDADILDQTYLVDFIFRGGPPAPCDVEADVNSDGLSATVLDLTYIIDVIFRGGPLPGPC